MRVDFEFEVNETKKKRKPKKTRKWCLSDRNLKYNYFKNQIELYENKQDLTPAERRFVEGDMYRFRETHELSQELLELAMGSYEMMLDDEIKQCEEIDYDGYLASIEKAIPKLTVLQQKILALYLDGKDFAEIAKLLGTDSTSIWHNFYGQHRRYKGEKKLYGGIIQALKTAIEREELLKKIKEMTLAGYTAHKMGKRLGIMEKTAMDMIKELDIKAAYDAHREKEKAMLEERRAKCLELSKEGKSQRAIGREIGVSQTEVRRILNNEY